MSEFQQDFTRRMVLQERLLKVFGGRYILFVVAVIQLIAPAISFSFCYYYISSLIAITNAQVQVLIISTLSAAGIIYPLTLIFAYYFDTPHARARLNAISHKQPLANEGEFEAWKEIVSLPTKLASQVSALIIFLLGLPTLALMYWVAHINGMQFIYLVIGLFGPITALIGITALLLELALAPARDALVPQAFQNQKTGLEKARIASRMSSSFFILGPVSIILIGLLGYQKLLMAMTPGVDLQANLQAFQQQNLIMSITTIAVFVLVAFLIILSVTFPLQSLVTTMTQIEQTGQLSLRAPVVSADEIGFVTIQFNKTLGQLETLHNSQEKVIAERTAQLKATNEVGRIISAILDPEELIPRFVNLITDRFGHYYSALFVVDPTGKWAELKSATGEAGRVLRASRHRLAVDSKSMVGTAVSQKQARIALDVGAEPVRFNNPLLPYTRSEIALPLMVGEHILGVLDIQSTREAAFEREDIETFQNMANQVAVALENARLFQETNQRVQELQTLQRQYLREAWTAQATGEKLEYAVGDKTLSPTETGFNVPLTLRDEIIGQISLTGEQEWSPEERAWVESVATQAAIALENARLMDESRKQAGLERTVAEVTTRVWSANTIDGILQTAAKEIGRALNLSEASIELRLEEQGAADE
jgi:GAF domain-containing protein